MQKKERNAPACVDGGGIYDDRWLVTRYDDPPFCFFRFFEDHTKKIDCFLQAKVTVVV